MKGGYRIKKKTNKGQALLLDALWERFGGVSEVAKLVGASAATVAMWRRDGRVPANWLSQVSKALKVSPWALNFKFLSELEISEDPLWAAIVSRCNLLDGAKRKVLKGDAPY